MAPVPANTPQVVFQSVVSLSEDTPPRRTFSLSWDIGSNSKLVNGSLLQSLTCRGDDSGPPYPHPRPQEDA